MPGSTPQQAAAMTPLAAKIRELMREAADQIWPGESPADGFTVEAMSASPEQVDYRRTPRCVHEWMAQNGEWPEQPE